MVRNREGLQDQAEPEEARLVQDILAANIRVTTKQRDGHQSKELSVGQLLDEYNEFRTELEAKGIHLVHERGSGQSFLFVVPAPVLRHLLKGYAVAGLAHRPDSSSRRRGKT